MSEKRFWEFTWLSMRIPWSKKFPGAWWKTQCVYLSAWALIRLTLARYLGITW